MAIILSGTNVRYGLLERRTELIRCAAITKDNLFDEQIAELDVAIAELWDAEEIMLLARTV